MLRRRCSRSKMPSTRRSESELRQFLVRKVAPRRCPFETFHGHGSNANMCALPAAENHGCCCRCVVSVARMVEDVCVPPCADIADSCEM